MFTQATNKLVTVIAAAFLLCNACIFDTRRFTTQEGTAGTAGSSSKASAGSLAMTSGGSIQRAAGSLVSAGSSTTTTAIVAGRASASGGSTAINGGAYSAGGSTVFAASGGATVIQAYGGSTTTPINGGSTSKEVPCFSADITGIKLEADYILSSQVMDQNAADGGYGAIKHRPDSSNSIPSEVSLAGIALIQASKALGDPKYRDRAALAADYLSRVVDPIYGGWRDEYNGAIVTKKSLSVRQSALIAIFLYQLGLNDTRAATMKSVGGFIDTHRSTQNKKGADDGLVCKGRDEKGVFIGERWLSDNVLAYHAMTMSASWAEPDGDPTFVNELRTNAAKILNGIKTHLYDSTKRTWIRMISVDGSIPSETAATVDWVNYSPALFELPVTTIPITDTGIMIHDALQLSSGGVVWDNSNYRARQSPLYSFQASLIWRRAGQCAFANSAMDWAKTNAWRLSKDANGLTGGWLDWIETSGNKPNDLERSVETSAYAILNWTGFSFAP